MTGYQRAENIAMALVVLNYVVRQHGIEFRDAETHLWLLILWKLMQDVAHPDDERDAA